MSGYDDAFNSAFDKTSGGKADPYDEIAARVVPQVRQAVREEVAGNSPPTAVSAGRAVNSIPRQLGLTARYALEGPAEAAQIVTEPVAGVMRAFGVPTKSTGQLASTFADYIGLPKPENANERVIGDASKLVAGSAATMGAGRAASAIDGLVGKIGGMFASNPGQQMSSAAGAGLAAGASREADGGTAAQIGAGVLGGLAGGMVPAAGAAIGNLSRRVTTPALTNLQMDAKIGAALATRDVDYSAIPDNIRSALRTELRSSLQAGKELDPDAVRRLADIRAAGLTPTRGMVSQDPVQITRERNLSKIAANQGSDVLHGLPRIENANNRALIARLNDVGGATETDPLAVGRLLNGSVLGQQTALRGAEKEAWLNARNSPGYTQPISPAPLNAINSALQEEGQMLFMNPTISRYMADFQMGRQPFTPQAYRNLQSMLANEMSVGGNPAAAAGTARRALEASDILPVAPKGGISDSPAAIGQSNDAISAVDRARAATRQAYAYEESSPMVRSILSDSSTSDPQRIANRFIINGTPDEAAIVAQQVGETGRQQIRNALATHIKRQALSGASDEVGKVSQSRLNSAINSVGLEKLRLFFSPEEIATLQATGRAASYAQVQPVGSAVNNSNSGALVLGRGADLLGNLSKKIPFGQQLISDPLRSINISLSQRAAENVRPGLLMAPPSGPLLGSGLFAPGVALGGLLAAPTAP